VVKRKQDSMPHGQDELYRWAAGSSLASSLAFQGDKTAKHPTLNRQLPASIPIFLVDGEGKRRAGGRESQSRTVERR
jgi:hypothetical protein